MTQRRHGVRYHRPRLQLLGIERRVRQLERANHRDPDLFARLHDALLFLCAYPPDARTLRRAESLLKRFGKLARSIDPLLDPEVAGIAGTSVDTVFTLDFVRWLANRFRRDIDIDWDEPPDPDRLAAVLTTLVPTIEEEVVDANVPYFDRLEEMGGLHWLLRNLDSSALYDSLGLWILWRLRDPVTRTFMRRKPRRIFFQTTPLLSRREVSIERELAGPPLRITRLSRRQGEKALDMARAALGVRYREVYCFTYGDASTIVSADCGRGVEILLIGIVPEKRLPLRAGFAPFILRNGVPIGYADAFGLCERMEVSFNIFYAFRDGESAYCFARLLKLYRQLFGSTTFSLDRYQIGFGNDEAIEAGAFWFYRKLGFRPTDPRVERLARREEARMASDRRHRTSARTLRRLAESSMIYGSSEWDRFSIHQLVPRIDRVLALFPPEITRAKRGRSEGRYLRLLARDGRLRRALIRLGSSPERRPRSPLS